jgi:hypothetical protein
VTVRASEGRYAESAGGRYCRGDVLRRRCRTGGAGLAVVFTVGEERLTVAVSTLNQVGPEQLTPVAEELIANLQR